MAHWLVNQFAPELDCIFLVARSRPKSEYFWQKFHQMREYCQVEFVQADVADFNQMDAIFKRYKLNLYIFKTFLNLIFLIILFQFFIT